MASNGLDSDTATAELIVKGGVYNLQKSSFFYVCSSVPQSHCKSGTPTQSVKISTLYHNFLIHYCRDFSHILHICTWPLVDYLI